MTSRMTGDLDLDGSDSLHGSASTRRAMVTLDERHREQLRKVEKERREAQEVGGGGFFSFLNFFKF